MRCDEKNIFFFFVLKLYSCAELDNSSSSSNADSSSKASTSNTSQGNSEATSNNDSNLQTTFLYSIALQNQDELPPCNEEHKNQLVYIFSENTFLVCSSSGTNSFAYSWATIDAFKENQNQTPQPITCNETEILVWADDKWKCTDVNDMVAARQGILSEISCNINETIKWIGDQWACRSDLNSQLTEDDVDNFVGNNDYAVEFSDLNNIPTGLSDGDDNTQLTEEQVDNYVSNNGYISATLTDNEVIDIVENGNYKTEVEINTIINGKGYKTETEIDTIIEGKGYITEDTTLSQQDVLGIVDAGNYKTATEIDTIIESKGYITEDTTLSQQDVLGIVENGNYKTADEINTIFEGKGYISATLTDNEVLGIVDTGNYKTADEINTIIEGKGYITATLTEAEVDSFVSNNGYITEDKTLTETQVDNYVANNGYATIESVTYFEEDINSDSIKDIFTLMGNSLILLKSNTANDDFDLVSIKEFVADDGSPQTIILKDLDADGDFDIIVGTSTELFIITTDYSSNNFAATNIETNNPDITHLSVIDINEDETATNIAILAFTSDNKVYLYKKNGDGDGDYVPVEITD